MVCIYKRKHFLIYSADSEFIVHNRNKDFKKGHTHISNYNTAKYLISMSLSKKIPFHASKYIYESLIRLSNDQNYINELKKKR